MFKTTLAAFLTGVAALSATTVMAANNHILTVYTYDSFTSEWGPGPAIEIAFERECNCDLQFVGLDSSIGILGRVQIEGENSKADIVLGLDTNLTEIARETGLFVPHGSEAKAPASPPKPRGCGKPAQQPVPPHLPPSRWKPQL